MATVVAIIVLYLSCMVFVSAVQSREESFYLMVSFDGFRYDYLDIVKQKGRQTPNFDRIIESGVKAKHMKPAFPSTTWPNHWAIATGMNVESHGVVANFFYDAKLMDSYDSPNTPDVKWYNNGTDGGGGEPIWVTYEKAGQKSGAAVWPASTTPVGGIVPSYSLPQDNEGISKKARVDAIIEWFTRERDPAHLGMLYFDEPDDSGHNFGPDSKEVEDMIVELDGILGYLLEQLTVNNLLDRVNMVIVSDHGMTNVVHTYSLDEYVDPSLYILSGETPTIMFLPTEGNEEKLVASLKTVPHSTYYRKEDMPREYFYTYNDRILPHLLLSEIGYRICCFNGSKPLTTVGNHGYNNSLPDMWPFFLARGPAFKDGYVSAPFNNTDIYPLMCHLLGVEPHPNDGSLDNIRHILASNEPAASEAHVKASKTREAVVQLTKSVVGLILMFGIAGFVTLVYFTVHKRGQHRRNRPTQDLTVSVPISRPHFALTTRNDHSTRADRKWLLEHNGEESDDLEEWMPISIGTGEQTQPGRQT